ncbi:MAG: sugar phosphate nucleotidyltransferase [Terriglobales bacterium]
MPDAPEPDVAILCGGLGTRLRPVFSSLPKCLAPVGGRPFLDHLLAQLEAQPTFAGRPPAGQAEARLRFPATGARSARGACEFSRIPAGCRRIVLCTGYGAEAFQARYAHWRGPGVELILSTEAAPLGTGGALALALPQLRTDPVLVLNGDSIVPGLDFAAVRRTAARQSAAGAAGVVVLVPADGRRDIGAVGVDASGRLTSFAEKSAAGAAALQNAGVYLLRRGALEAIPADRPSSLERDWLPRWLSQGLGGYVHNGALVDIGTPERWARAQEQWV